MPVALLNDLCIQQRAVFQKNIGQFSFLLGVVFMATSGVCLVVLQPHALAFCQAPRKICGFFAEPLHRRVRAHTLRCIHADEPDALAVAQQQRVPVYDTLNVFKLAMLHPDLVD